MKRTHVLDEPGKWRIVWQDGHGFRGHGAAVMEHHIAKRVAEGMNKTAPSIHHWIEQAETPAPAGNPAAEAGTP